MSIQASIVLPDLQVDVANLVETGFGVWDWKLGDNLLFADEYVAKLFNLDPVKAKNGLPPEMFLSRIIPADRPDVENSIAVSLDSLGTCFNQFRIYADNGDIRWICTRGKSFGLSQGQPDFIVGLAMALDKPVKEEEDSTLSFAQNQPALDIMHLCAIAKEIAVGGDLNFVTYLLDMISLELKTKLVDESSSRH